MHHPKTRNFIFNTLSKNSATYSIECGTYKSFRDNLEKHIIL
jgi:hypothetical protein